MIDLKMINQAIHDTLRQIASDDLRFVVVMWDRDNHAISSNELDTPTLIERLKGATLLVETSDPKNYRVDNELAGNA